MKLIKNNYFITLLSVSLSGVISPAFSQQISESFEPQDLLVNFAGRNSQERSHYSLVDMGLQRKDLYKLWLKTENPSSFPSELDIECLKNPDSWEATAVRFVPVSRSTYMPGAFKDWKNLESKNNYDFEKIVQVRVVVRPFCKGFSGEDGLVPRDFGLHLIYNLIPQWLKPNYEQLLTAFANGDSNSVANVLSELDGKLRSAEYKQYRDSILKEWSGVFQWRNQQSRDQISRNLSRNFASIEEPVKSDYIHPHLSQGGNSSYGKFVITFLKKWANTQNLKDVTTMLTSGGLIWRFDSFEYINQRFEARDELKTFRLHVLDKGAVISPVAIQDKDSIDLVHKVDSVSEADFNAREMQFRPMDERNFSSEFKAKLLNLDASNPTTMSCKGCHSILTNPFDGAQYDFHMLPPGQINAVTSQELIEESQILNKQYGLSQSQKPTPDQPDDGNTCTVVESGYANVRSPSNFSFIRFSAVTGTKLIKVPELNSADGSRIGVALTYSIPHSVTSCGHLEPSHCVNDAYVDTHIGDSLGSKSAVGVFVEVNNKRVAVVADKTSLTVTQATPSGLLHVKTRGTIAKGMCE